MGAYDRFRTADIMGVRNYIKEGNHILLVKRTEMSKTKDPTKPKDTEKAVIEFKIVESDTQKVGQVCSLVEMSTSQGYGGNVLSATAGILGMDVDKMRDDPSFDSIFDAAWGVPQIFAGMLVRCAAQIVKTQKGEDYTAKTFEAVLASEYGKWGLIAPNGAYTGEDEPVEGAAEGAKTAA